MTKLRGYIPTMTLMLVMLFGVTAANAGDGIIIGGRTQQASTTTTDTEETSLDGIIIGGFKKAATFMSTGIIIGG